MLSGIMGNVVFCTLLPISIPVAKAFGLDTVFYVNLTIMMNMFNAAPMTFVSIWIYSHFSTSTVLRGVVTLLLVGTGFRALCYFTNSFWPVAVGAYFCSCCNAFLLNVINIVANKWFTDKERALATALLVVMSPIGVGVSYGMTGSWFIEIKNVEEDSEEFLRLFKSLMVVQFFMAAVLWVIFNLAIKEKPSKPPSAVAEVQYEPLSCKQSL